MDLDDLRPRVVFHHESISLLKTSALTFVRRTADILHGSRKIGDSEIMDQDIVLHRDVAEEPSAVENRV